MEKVFIPTSRTSREISDVIKMVEKLGLPKNSTYIGGSFAAFARQLTSGDTAIVSSLAIFGSINEILEQTTALAAKGIELRSIDEQWFGSKKLTAAEFATKLFALAAKIHTQTPANSCAETQTETNTKKTKLRRTMNSKIEQIERLRMEKKITVVEACKTAGCSIRTYYKHRPKA